MDGRRDGRTGRHTDGGVHNIPIAFSQSVGIKSSGLSTNIVPAAIFFLFISSHPHLADPSPKWIHTGLFGINSTLLLEV